MFKDRIKIKPGRGFNSLISGVIALVAIILAIYAIALISSGEEKIFAGIYINDIYVGYMTKNQAVKTLEDEFNIKLKERLITIKYESKIWQIGCREIGAHYDTDNAVNEAFRITKETSYIDKVLIELRLKKVRKDIAMGIVLDENKLSDKLKNIQKEIKKSPVNATISFDGNRFTVTRDEPGTDMDMKQINILIKDSIKSENRDVIIMPIIKIKANRTYDMLRTVSTRISSYSTVFNSGNENRATNIEVSTKTVNGKVLMPGEVFSLNKVLGPRIAKSGYREAPVIVNGEVVEGLGGGVCQAASTLYNAILLADLDIVERKNHGLPLSYIGLGRDATISGDYLDLKFKNNRKYPVYIRGFISGNVVCFEVYGDNTTPGVKVDIISDIIEVIKPKPKIVSDYSLSEGLEKVVIPSKDGYRVKSYRKTYVGGKLVRNEQLGDDIYKPVNGEIIRGKKLLGN